MNVDTHRSGRSRLSAFLRVHPWPIWLFPFLFAGLLAAAADDWPQFRGNPQLTGVSTSSVPDRLRLLWTYDAGESIESSAGIVDGTVYVGSQSKDLLAIDLETGKLRWKYRAADSIGESSPAVFDGVVYVGDLSGVLYAVRAADGKCLWTFKTGAEIRSSPVVAADRLLIGSYDANLYCLSRRDGKVLWKFTSGSYIHGTPAQAAGVAYVSGCDEVFHGIRLADGREVVRFPAGGPSAASPAIVGDRAWFGNFNNEVVAADLRRKVIAWRYRRPAAQFPFYSSAAAVNGRLVVGGRDKLVHCLNAASGAAIWTFATKARVDSSPAIAGGRLYIGSGDGHFYVLDLATGARLWDFEAGAPLSASPAIAAGRVVIGSQDGRLYCFGQ